MRRSLIALAICGTLIWIFVLMLNPVWSLDIWLHLKSGELIVKSFKIPATDPFTVGPCEEKPWIDLYWLFQIFQYAIHYFWGLTGLIISKSLVITLSSGLLIFYFCKQGAPILGTFLVFLGSFIFHYRALERPEVYSFLFFAIYLVILHRHQTRCGRMIYILIPLQILWVNFHTLFILGPLLCGAFLIGNILSIPPLFMSRLSKQHIYSLFWVTTAVVFVNLINPYGLKGILHPFGLLPYMTGQYNTGKETITELESMNLLTLTPLPRALAVYVLLVVSSILLVFNFRNMGVWSFFIYFGMFRLAVMAARNLPFWAMTAMMVSCEGLLKKASYFNLKKCQAIGSSFLILASCTGIFMVVTNHYYSLISDSRSFGIRGVASGYYPESATKFLQESNITGNVFNHLNDGAYLLYHLYPKRKIFIYGWLDIMGEKTLEDYIKMRQNRDYFEIMCDKYDITMALIREHPVYETLFRDNPGWRCVHTDPVAGSVIMLRLHSQVKGSKR